MLTTIQQRLMHEIQRWLADRPYVPQSVAHSEEEPANTLSARWTIVIPPADESQFRFALDIYPYYTVVHIGPFATNVYLGGDASDEAVFARYADRVLAYLDDATGGRLKVEVTYAWDMVIECTAFRRDDWR